MRWLARLDRRAASVVRNVSFRSGTTSKNPKTRLNHKNYIHTTSVLAEKVLPLVIHHSDAGCIASVISGSIYLNLLLLQPPQGFKVRVAAPPQS